MDWSANTSQLYLACLIAPCLLALCWYDCRYRKLPNPMTMGLAVLCAIARLYMGGMEGLTDGALGGLVCGLFLFIPFLLKSAGGGDVKMMFATGVIVGFRYSFAEMLFVSIAGLVLAIVLLCLGKVAAKRLLHYLRIIFDWRYDRKKGAEGLPPKESEKGRIPFGVAIAVGTLATLAYAYWLEAGV